MMILRKLHDRIIEALERWSDWNMEWDYDEEQEEDVSVSDVGTTNTTAS